MFRSPKGPARTGSAQPDPSHCAGGHEGSKDTGTKRRSQEATPAGNTRVGSRTYPP